MRSPEESYRVQLSNDSNTVSQNITIVSLSGSISGKVLLRIRKKFQMKFMFLLIELSQQVLISLILRILRQLMVSLILY